MKRQVFFAILLLIFFLSGCILDNPTKEKCSFKDNIDYECVVNAALKDNRPEYCNILGGSLDDPCMQDYYEKKNDPSICASIPKEGVKNNCLEYYGLIRK